METIILGVTNTSLLNILLLFSILLHFRSHYLGLSETKQKILDVFSRKMGEQMPLKLKHLAMALVWIVLYDWKLVRFLKNIFQSFHINIIESCRFCNVVISIMWHLSEIRKKKCWVSKIVNNFKLQKHFNTALFTHWILNVALLPVYTESII